jgi:hypothetical protein
MRTSVVDSEGLPSYRNKLSLSPVSFFDSQAGCHDHCSYVERYIELAIRPAEMGNKCRQSLQILQKAHFIANSIEYITNERRCPITLLSIK